MRKGRIESQAKVPPWEGGEVTPEFHVGSRAQGLHIPHPPGTQTHRLLRIHLHSYLSHRYVARPFVRIEIGSQFRIFVHLADSEKDLNKGSLLPWDPLFGFQPNLFGDYHEYPPSSAVKGRGMNSERTMRLKNGSDGEGDHKYCWDMKCLWYVVPKTSTSSSSSRPMRSSLSDGDATTNR